MSDDNSNENNETNAQAARLIMALFAGAGGSHQPEIEPVEPGSRVYQERPLGMAGASAARGAIGAGVGATAIDISGLKGRVNQAQQHVASVRTQPLDHKLVDVLNFAAEKSGVYVHVFSGGQSEKGEKRTGSHRHDRGKAADINLFTLDKNGKPHYLTFDSPEGRPAYEKFVESARAAGATGIGAGHGYMGPGAIHVGYGPEATWGAEGKTSNAPEWLRNAFERGRKNPVALIRNPSQDVASKANSPNRTSLKEQSAAHDHAPAAKPEGKASVALGNNNAGANPLKAPPTPQA